MKKYENPYFPRFKYRYGHTTGGPAPAPSFPEGKRVRRIVSGHTVDYILEPLGTVRVFIDGVEQQMSGRAKDLMLLGWPR